MRIKGLFLLFFLSCYVLGYSAIPVPDNNCLSFDGTNDYVALANEGVYDFTTEFTIEFWINVDEWTRPWQSIITKGDTAWRIHRNNETSKIAFQTGQGATLHTVLTDTDIEPGVWYHIMVQKLGGAGIIRIYVNGVLENSTSDIGLNCPTNNYNVMIGENAENTGRYFKGQLDDVRFWNYVRFYTYTLEGQRIAITNNAHNAPDLLDTGLVAYFGMNESSGSTIANPVGTGNNGTVYGASFVTSGTPCGPEWIGSLDLTTMAAFNELTFDYEITRVYSNIRINTSLTINPGVTVEFNGHFEIYTFYTYIDPNVYYAYIYAAGTETDSIRFTVADTTGFMSMVDEYDVDGGWAGLNLYQTGSTNNFFDHCVFEYGKANGTDSEDIFGGAIYLRPFSSVEILNSRFSHNIAAAGGGALAFMNDTWQGQEVELINCRFDNNISFGNAAFDGQGGAIYSGSKELNITYCHFYNNSASEDGGALYLENDGKPIDFFNNVVANNTAVNGGGIWIENYDGTGIYNNTFADNSATNGGGFYFSGDSDPVLQNNIIWSNEAGTGSQIYLASVNSDPNFEYCDIEGGLASFSGDGANSFTGTYLVCSDRDPLFVGTGAHPYDISDVSPCINAGKPGSTAGSYDLLGNPRIYNTGASGNTGINVILNTIDIGPYENQQEMGVLPYDFTLNSSLSLTHDLTIPDGTTFTADASIDFESNSGMNIYGSLIAEGETNQPINFTSTVATDQSFLSFFGPSLEENFSQLDYCCFKYFGASSTNIQYGGLIYVEGYDDLLIRNSLFKGGRAEYGSGIAFINSSAELNSCFFNLNEASSSGGAIYCSNSSPILANLTIFNNS